MSALSVEVQAVPAGDGRVEQLIWLRVPAAGGDGILLGVCESQQAAVEIGSALQRLFDLQWFIVQNTPPAQSPSPQESHGNETPLQVEHPQGG